MPSELSFWIPIALGAVNVLLNLRLQVSVLKQQRWVRRLFLGHLAEYHSVKVSSLLGGDESGDGE